MLDNSHNGSSAGNKNWTLGGLGSAYSPQPHLDTLHRGYGWGRLIDLDDDYLLSQANTARSDFHLEANELARRAKESSATK